MREAHTLGHSGGRAVVPPPHRPCVAAEDRGLACHQPPPFLPELHAEGDGGRTTARKGSLRQRA